MNEGIPNIVNFPTGDEHSKRLENLRTTKRNETIASLRDDPNFKVKLVVLRTLVGGIPDGISQPMDIDQALEFLQGDLVDLRNADLSLAAGALSAWDQATNYEMAG